MMIPYPSLSPIPALVNGTSATDSFDPTATIVTGVAVGALGIGSVAVLFQYLKATPKETSKPDTEEEDQIQLENTEVQMPDAVTYLCINTADLEDIKLILTAFKKRFHVMLDH